MSKRLSEPCARWAEQLTQADFSQLSDAERAALKAHLDVCPACAAVRADYLYTAARLRQAPDPAALPGLPPQLLQVWAREARRVPVSRWGDVGPLKEVLMQTTDYKPAPSAPAPTPAWRRAGHRAAAVMSGIAAVLVIALITTALIASHASNKPSTPGNNPGVSATSAQTRPLDQKWQALPHLANSSDETWLAPSDPRVVYQLALNDLRNQGTLRRSDDQGATWKTFPLPITSSQDYQTWWLYVSPTNAQHVLAINGVRCPSGQAAAAGPLARFSDGETCSVVFFSSNGGANWAPVTLPAHGSHNLFFGLGIQAQENWLYAVLYVEPGMTASELVMSRDDGGTWQFADAGLTPEQHCLQGLAVPATGTTLFAATLDQCGNSFSGAATAQLWRSDDAGARWAAVGATSAISALNLEAVKVSGQTQPVLIRSGAQAADPRAMEFSRDDGKTWQPVPALGDQASGQGQVGILKDGSLLEQARDGFYAWKPGDSGWHKVAPALAGTVIGSMVVADKNGKETLYLEVRDDSANVSSFYSFDLG